ncbi:tRNA (adenosine(37)-N6)-threonylcarbamoyltransferase complex ATPase subunit type 1 TsaE [Pedobacter sp. MC2016-14]|uniref:tRNA (adenosine(37)-N6)-threonylcarbamoyltransferase complex ATPase subunit type 1 TsaE n=1 Tax=Pedobacter sp. MC2016-14 TaxID=2897327 RepID=UPI001E47D92C|nr:tRNA (adenosine(37)-N6)-threonylcarbamoyltransferase complex ATPase subunit type 1 TsaE [Pedobacter sp. MC2016-14]MCD0487307.1 tRNA (adenosine(37)-N6)-threonylcarbamoyltransferase complex ATPase subunit type 1 TsaE [Pedobacter sp. MC2016-14]
MEFEVNQLSDLKAAANALITLAGKNKEKLFIFEGEMGAGKTTFIKEICAALGVTETVSSPTFSIVNEYEGDGEVIYHFDFYRIKNLQEAYDIGYEDYFDSGNICLIEWPEKIAALLLQENYIKIQISILGPEKRKLLFTTINH